MRWKQARPPSCSTARPARTCLLYTSVLAGVQDNALVGQAFTAAFGSFGPKFIAVSILVLAYSTTLGWSHYGTKAVELSLIHISFYRRTLQ